MPVHSDGTIVEKEIQNPVVKKTLNLVELEHRITEIREDLYTLQITASDLVDTAGALLVITGAIKEEVQEAIGG